MDQRRGKNGYPFSLGEISGHVKTADCLTRTLSYRFSHEVMLRMLQNKRTMRGPARSLPKSAKQDHLWMP